MNIEFTLRIYEFDGNELLMEIPLTGVDLDILSEIVGDDYRRSYCESWKLTDAQYIDLKKYIRIADCDRPQGDVFLDCDSRE